jgi:hypothetical protein
MSSRSERYLAKAEKCQQISDAADTSGIKRLYAGAGKPMAAVSRRGRRDRQEASGGENPPRYPSEDRHEGSQSES